MPFGQEFSPRGGFIVVVFSRSHARVVLANDGVTDSARPSSEP